MLYFYGNIFKEHSLCLVDTGRGQNEGIPKIKVLNIAVFTYS